MKCIKLILFIISACCIYHSSLNAQIKLTQYVFGNGAVGSNTVLSGTIGQPIIGNTSSALHSNNFGFWYQYTETMTDIEEKQINEKPIEFQLFQNYPNPFNPSTTIRYGLPRESHVKLTLYNILGKKIIELVNTTQQAGYHEVNFNASDFASGVYIYIIYSKALDGSRDFRSVKKLILSK